MDQLGEVLGEDGGALEVVGHDLRHGNKAGGMTELDEKQSIGTVLPCQLCGPPQ
jgi:hypothetical protein